MKHLEETNPAQVWLKVRLSAQFELRTGHAIVVKFDVPSAVGAKKVTFTGDTVWERWARAILGTDAEAPAHSVRIREAVKVSEDLASLINKNLGEQAGSIIEHCTLSFSVLDALKEKRFRSARDMLIKLAMILTNFEPQSSNVGWGEWVIDCSKYMEKNGMGGKTP